MQYAAKLSPRGVISSGRGSSSAGLTVTAIKDGGQWALEAGALILADGQLLTHGHVNNLQSMSWHEKCNPSPSAMMQVAVSM